jgi:hypothetical protein
MSSRTDTLRFVTFLAPELYDVYQAMADYVGEALDVPVSLAIGAHRYDIFARGDADFGFI